METATILVIFVSSLLLGITAYSIYTAFGPVSKNLRELKNNKATLMVLLFNNSRRFSKEYCKKDYY